MGNFQALHCRINFVWFKNQQVSRSETFSLVEPSFGQLNMCNSTSPIIAYFQ